jgi:alpha-glucosidase
MYVAEVYADAAGADWEQNPLALEIKQILVDSKTTLELRLAPGGGQAIRFRPASEEDTSCLSRYESLLRDGTGRGCRGS